MSDKEFFRAVYRKTRDSDGAECVVPAVWMGNQGFELNAQYGEEGMTAQQHAEWFVSMFKKAIDNYAEQHLEDVLVEEIENLEHQLKVEGFETSFELQIASDRRRCLKVTLNHLKQRKG